MLFVVILGFDYVCIVVSRVKYRGLCLVDIVIYSEASKDGKIIIPEFI